MLPVCDLPLVASYDKQGVLRYNSTTPYPQGDGESQLVFGLTVFAGLDVEIFTKTASQHRKKICRN